MSNHLYIRGMSLIFSLHTHPKATSARPVSPHTLPPSFHRTHQQTQTTKHDQAKTSGAEHAYPQIMGVLSLQALNKSSKSKYHLPQASRSKHSPLPFLLCTFIHLLCCFLHALVLLDAMGLTFAFFLLLFFFSCFLFFSFSSSSSSSSSSPSPSSIGVAPPSSR